ncbi:MAG: glutaminyl-peptide cyclotransferase, partial [Acidimicrobiales bacterium]|nr:glutaminyl-peptide cyclotransferase [Acidimicrobiales bacterium]
MRHLLVIVLLLALLGAACGDDDTTGATSDTQTPSPSTALSDDGAADTGDPSDGTGTADDDELPPPTAVDGVEQLVPQVVSRRAHDTTAFTQGLEFVGDRLFESTGIHGES